MISSSSASELNSGGLGKRGSYNCTQGQGVRRESGRLSNRYTGGPEGVWTCRRESV